MEIIWLELETKFSDLVSNFIKGFCELHYFKCLPKSSNTCINLLFRLADSRLGLHDSIANMYERCFGTTSKPTCRSTDSSVQFQLVLIVLNNDQALEPDGTVGQAMVWF